MLRCNPLTTKLRLNPFFFKKNCFFPPKKALCQYFLTPVARDEGFVGFPIYIYIYMPMVLCRWSLALYLLSAVAEAAPDCTRIKMDMRHCERSFSAPRTFTCMSVLCASSWVIACLLHVVCLTIHAQQL